MARIFARSDRSAGRMQDENCIQTQPLVAPTRQPCTGPSCDGVDPSADDVASDAGCRRLRRDTHPQLLPHPHARKPDRDVPPERPGRRGRLESAQLVPARLACGEAGADGSAPVRHHLGGLPGIRFVAAHQHHLGLSFSRNQRRPAPPLERGRGDTASTCSARPWTSACRMWRQAAFAPSP